MSPYPLQAIGQPAKMHKKKDKSRTDQQQANLQEERPEHLSRGIQKRDANPKAEDQPKRTIMDR